MRPDNSFLRPNLIVQRRDRTGRWTDAVSSNVNAYNDDLAMSQRCIAPYEPEHNTALLIYAASMAGEVGKHSLHPLVLCRSCMIILHLVSILLVSSPALARWLRHQSVLLVSLGFEFSFAPDKRDLTTKLPQTIKIGFNCLDHISNMSFHVVNFLEP